MVIMMMKDGDRDGGDDQSGLSLVWSKCEQLLSTTWGTTHGLDLWPPLGLHAKCKCNSFNAFEI